MLRTSPMLFFTIITIFVIIVTGNTISMDFHVQNYSETSCTVMATEVVPVFKDSSTRVFRARVQLEYTANGVSYTKWARASRISPDTATLALAQERLNSFQINNKATCWYDPTDPNIVVLEKGYHLHALMGALGTILFLIWIWLIQGASIGAYKKPTTGIAPDGSLFQIKENRYTTELIYFGKEKLTYDKLPPKYKNSSQFAKKMIAERLNRNGRIVSVKPPYIYYLFALGMLLSIILYFGDQIISFIATAN